MISIYQTETSQEIIGEFNTKEESILLLAKLLNLNNITTISSVQSDLDKANLIDGYYLTKDNYLVNIKNVIDKGYIYNGSKLIVETLGSLLYIDKNLTDTIASYSYKKFMEVYIQLCNDYQIADCFEIKLQKQIRVMEYLSENDKYLCISSIVNIYRSNLSLLNYIISRNSIEKEKYNSLYNKFTEIFNNATKN